MNLVATLFYFLNCQLNQLDDTWSWQQAFWDTMEQAIMTEYYGWVGIFLSALSKKRRKKEHPRRDSNPRSVSNGIIGMEGANQGIFLPQYPD